MSTKSRVKRHERRGNTISGVAKAVTSPRWSHGWQQGRI
jgi:hypothetical protein